MLANFSVLIGGASVSFEIFKDEVVVYGILFCFETTTIHFPVPNNTLNHQYIIMMLKVLLVPARKIFKTVKAKY